MGQTTVTFGDESHITTRRTDYLQFEWIGSSASGKTHVYRVISRRSGDVLGGVKWFGRWRQYTFYPSDATIWNRQCLDDISAFLAELNKR